MLAIEKENLLAATNQEIARLRETELRYYIDHIGSIQTMATLLAGFSFAALVQTNTLNLDTNDVYFLSRMGILEQRNETAGTSVSTPIYDYSYDGWRYMSFVMRAGELVCFILSLGEMLQVMTESLISRQLGSRLALRGPDGSIIHATRNLAQALASTTRGFFKGLQYFLLSVTFYTLRGQHPAVAIILNCIIYRYWRKQGELAGRLSAVFHVREGISTAFADEERHRADRVPRSAIAAAASAHTQTHGGLSGSSSFKTRVERAYTFKRSTLDYLNPVGHHLKFLTQEVSNDFNGASVANARHKNPAAATKHLIQRTEKKQAQVIALEEERSKHDGRAYYGEGELTQEFAKGWHTAKNAADSAVMGILTPLRRMSATHDERQVPQQQQQQHQPMRQPEFAGCGATTATDSSRTTDMPGCTPSQVDEIFAVGTKSAATSRSAPAGSSRRARRGPLSGRMRSPTASSRRLDA